MRILLIDDDAAFRTIFKIRLVNEGRHDVLTAENGKEGLEIAAGDNLDLILLDIMMPEMDGIEVLGKLKEDEKTRQIPVFMLTAKNDISDVQKCSKLGADSYLVKPILTNDLNKFLRTRLDKAHQEKQKNP